jgi:primase-polymerase (primpol)-like protein
MAEREPLNHEAQRLQGSVPEELQAYPQFVVWRPVEINQKYKKIPFNPRTGEKASPTDLSTWGSFPEALQAYMNGRGKGIGFAFADTDPFTGIDLDHCIDESTGVIAPWVKPILDQFPGTYQERSQSDRGIHIIVIGHIPHGRRTDHIEIYSEGRYFALTGNKLPNTPASVVEHQKALDDLYHSLDPKPAPKALEMRQGHFYHALPDERVIEKAIHAKNGAQFAALWAGKWEGTYSSKSHADWQLVMWLMFWCNDDVEQVERLFHQSGLLDEKTDSMRGAVTYLQHTIHSFLAKRRLR